MIQRILRHLAGHGIIVLMVAVAFLVLLRGLNVGIILLFVLPPLFAMLHTRPTFSAATRWVAWAFLGAVGLGSLIAPFPQLFPKLGGVAQQLAPWQDRMLAWYTAVYLLWFLAVLPIHVFGGNLRAHERGEDPRFSRVTCFLGLLTAGLLSPTLPWVLLLLGFWPVL